MTVQAKVNLAEILTVASAVNHGDANKGNAEKFSVDKEIARVIYNKIVTSKARSAWAKGVSDYACGLFETACDWIFDEDYQGETSDILYLKEKDLLDGASSWHKYSWGGRYYCCDYQIAEALCTPSELKKKKYGALKPNSREEWLDVQARALYQAAQSVLEKVSEVRNEIEGINKTAC